MKRILISANPDLNFIDGSSIWLQTISLVCASAYNVKVDLIAKSPIERHELFQPLEDNENINIIDGTKPTFWAGNTTARLTQYQLAQLAVQHDQKICYDVVIVRGLEIAKQLIDSPETLSKCWIYLTDIPQKIELFEQALIEQLTKIAMGCEKVLCQTNEFMQLWQEVIPELPSSKIGIYSPVIPDFDPGSFAPISERTPKAVYAGKYTQDWMTFEMVDLWPNLSDELDDAELIMIGDKIHKDASQENYQEVMQTALETTQGVTWLGALSRENVQKQLQHARVGLSWRAGALDDSIEYSTKILEYGGAGCSVILNRNALHERMLGEDYPLFANTEQEYIKQVQLALTNDEIAELSANRISNFALQHTFSERISIVENWLSSSPQKSPKIKSGKTTVLIAGHDLKFVTLLQAKLEATGEFEFIIDQWQGHNKHDIVKSMALIGQADVIFCEWCLGNLQWYSHHKLPWQKLIARFHLQERELPYVAESSWAAIDHISYVSEFIRREGQKTFGFPFEKTSVIPNLLDDDKFFPKKKTGEAKYTLGLIGSAPARKRLDKAIDLLEALLEKDSRYILRVKGKNPLDYGWLLKRDDELEYYTKIFERINSSPKLRHKVIFDPPGDDINDWFSMVGFILSPSDFESFHMAIGEGMLTGTHPIIWDWDGASEIWGKEVVISGVEQAMDKILCIEESQYKEAKACREYIVNLHSSSECVKQWKKVIAS
jgi:glycosyltransferase involved in cell wall biosynthesis